MTTNKQRCGFYLSEHTTDYLKTTAKDLGVSASLYMELLLNEDATNKN